jgi:hypothetical protein
MTVDGEASFPFDTAVHPGDQASGPFRQHDCGRGGGAARR